MKPPVFVCTLLAAIAVNTTCRADTFDSAQRALEIISRTAVTLCSQPPLRGETTSVELSAGAKVELARLLRYLVDIGVSGAAKYQRVEYSGLLQRDLATALRDANECRLRVYDGLKDRLLDQAFPSEASTSANIRGASAEGVYGNTRCQSQADENGASASCKKGIR